MTDEQILSYIGRQAHQTAGYKQIVHELGLRGGNERRLLAQRLAKLVQRGTLLELQHDRFSLPQAAAARTNAATGKLSVHRDGYGFVTPDDHALREKLDGDVFIPRGETGNAMHGDRVLVQLRQGTGDRRAEGTVVSVLKRSHPSVVGVFHYGTRHNYVVPMEDRLSHPVMIAKGDEYPPEQSAAEKERNAKSNRDTPHRVLGKEVQRQEWEDLEGVVVDVEITNFPSGGQNARGRVTEILGYEDDFGVDVEIMIRKHHIPHTFPEDVLEEARSIAAAGITEADLEDRTDYRDLPIVTIDGETARDFDDAVLVYPLDHGHYELHVHIADVAHYVQPGSAIDNEARLRGTSVYFPDRAVPMLPLELSTDLCSLRPQVDRLVLSCVMEIDPQGEIVGYKIDRGVIRSAARMTYTKVHQIIEGDAETRKEYAALVPEFERMYKLAQILNRKRVRRGSIDFDLPEPVIEFDAGGLMTGVSRSERNWAHRLIEEFMLSANECVASYLEEQRIVSIYRIHEKPEPKKVYEFETIAASFGYSLGVGALPIKRMQMRSEKRQRHGSGRNPQAIEIPEEVHITPHMYQKLTRKIAGTAEERILSYLMLRSLKQARYSEQNEGHFALAAPTYTHFTSPIRRYPDLIVHRILHGVLADGVHDGVGRGLSEASPWAKPAVSSKKGKHSAEEYRPVLEGPIDEQELKDIAEESSQSERRADAAESELIDWKKIRFMQDRVGEEFNALIVSVTKYGLFVELFDMFIEGLVPIATLDDDRYIYREATRQIVGQRSGKQYSVGDKVKVLLDRIDRIQRKLQFALIEERPEKAKAKRSKEKDKSKKKKRG